MGRLLRGGRGHRSSALHIHAIFALLDPQRMNISTNILTEHRQYNLEDNVSPPSA